VLMSMSTIPLRLCYGSCKYLFIEAALSKQYKLGWDRESMFSACSEYVSKFPNW
jgi:hypothetical protein